jgi:GNAT superfamily N-acetyltransferase
MHIREAIAADNEELQALQARCPMGTNLIVQAVNTPDFFARAKAYENYKVFAACEGAAIVGSAACGVRDAIVNGELRRVGYEFQAFTSPEHRRKGVAVQLHQRREEYIREQGGVLSYTLIMEGNIPAMRYIEHQGFARYRTVVMPALAVHRKMDLALGAMIRAATREDAGAIADLMNDTWQGHELYGPTSAAAFAGFVDRTPAYGLENVFVLETEGKMAACVGCWDWTRITRLSVQALSFKMRIMGLALDAMRLFRPMPRSVRPGDLLTQIVLTPVAFRGPADLAVLLRYLNNEALARGIEQIFCICEPGHPLLRGLKGFLHIDTTVYLYTKPLQAGTALGRGPAFIDGVDL